MSRFCISIAVVLWFCVPRQVAAQQNFPENFVGHWKGTMQWMKAGKEPTSFSMQLRIFPADSIGQYNWQIIYGDQQTDNRPYLLKPIDAAKGHWTIDERNGILLDSYLHGLSFHGAFTVQGNTIVDNYSLQADGRMQVEFFSIALDNKKTTGYGTEEVPLVVSYRIGSYQSGVLEKIK